MESGRFCDWWSFVAPMLAMAMALVLVAPLARAQLNPADLQVLVDIKQSMSDLPGTQFLQTWDFDFAPCNFFVGVSCAESSGISRIVILSLGSPNGGLTGQIPLSIGNLNALTQLSIAPGQVWGVIPDSVGLLRSLQFLGLSNNRLEGSIPNSLQNCQNLEYLDLSSNHFSGSIPQGLANAPSLISVDLAHNNLGGSIPSFTSSRLSHLDLSKNALSGTLPGYLPNSLRFFSVLKNGVGGSIDVIGGLSNLEYLDLGRNLFTGSLPQQIFSFPLNYLLLHRNLFSGAINPSGPVLISEVDLSNNKFTGSLSPYLATVESLYVNNNLFTGPVPGEFTNGLLAGSLKNLYIQHNYLTSFSLGSSVPFVASLCTQYNCFIPPGGTPCPAKAGRQISRPPYQCN